MEERKYNKPFTIYGIQSCEKDAQPFYLPCLWSEIVECANNQEAIDYLCSKHDRVISIWEGMLNMKETKETEPIYKREK